MVGPGAWQADAGDELRAFVERTGIPVYSDFQAHGLLPSSHALYGGTYHKLADLTAPDARPDVVLALGVRFGLFTMGVSDRLVPSAAKLIHVDVDAKEIGRLRDAAVPSWRTAARRCARSTRRHASSGAGRIFARGRRRSRTRRRRTAAKLIASWLTRDAPPIHPYQAVSAIADTLPEDTIVVGDGAESYHWLNEVIRQERAGSYITHGFLGAVGFGLGLALGAQVAHPERRVLCLAGDGAIGFTIAEFDTMCATGCRSSW